MALGKSSDAALTIAAEVTSVKTSLDASSAEVVAAVNESTEATDRLLAGNVSLTEAIESGTTSTLAAVSNLRTLVIAGVGLAIVTGVVNFIVLLVK